MAQNEPTRRSGQNPEIPDKLYFRIGDVAKLCDVPAYVLRFWEAEFPQLKPNKGGTGQRLYRRKDVEMVLRVKRLLYDEGYTIPGARHVLKTEQRPAGGPQLALAIEPTVAGSLKEMRGLQLLRRELQDVHALLSKPIGQAKSTVRSIASARGPRLASSLSHASRPYGVVMDDLFVEQPSLVVSGSDANET